MAENQNPARGGNQGTNRDANQEKQGTPNRGTGQEKDVQRKPGQPSESGNRGTNR